MYIRCACAPDHLNLTSFAKYSNSILTGLFLFKPTWPAFQRNMTW